MTNHCKRKHNRKKTRAQKILLKYYGTLQAHKEIEDEKQKKNQDEVEREELHTIRRHLPPHSLKITGLHLFF